MTPERRKQVDQIYRSALECDPTSRDAYLNEACAGDEQLTNEVKSRLATATPFDTPTESFALPSPPTSVVLQYEILGQIGAGGMGRVFQARDLKLDRIVALKFLAPHLLDSELAHRRFVSEAKLLSALNHPNIATIFDVDEVDGQPFLVLEYLPGGTLRTKVAKLLDEGRTLPAAELLNYAIGIAQGLAHAHRAKIVHRDVKTGNVLLSSENIVKVTDFGLARFRDSAHVTGPGRAVGTAAYMSPEQALGREIDHRSDIFSFGIVLYELATGSLPFCGDDWQALLYQIVHTTGHSISESRPDLPRGLDETIKRALQKEPVARYQRMEEMLEDLELVRRQVEFGEDLDSVRPSRVPPLRRPSRWFLAIAALIVSMSLAAVVPAVRNGISHLFPGQKIQAARHLAVLPFVNVGSDPASQAFCDGLVESLTSNLTQLEQFQGSLLVVPASEVRRQGTSSVREAQASFGVNFVITGSIQRAGDLIRVTVNLADARSLVQLAARTLDVRREMLATLQDRLLDVVAGLLDVQLQPQARTTVTAGGTSIPDAYDEYLQGRGYLRRFDKKGNLESAIGAFQLALQRDPHYALAHAGLGEAYRRLFERDHDPQWLEQAQAEGARSVELNPRLAPAHVSLGMIYAATGRHPQAVAEYQKALDLDPINPDGYRELANSYEAQNKIREAEATYRKALQLRPGDWLSNGSLGIFLYRRSRYPEAEPYLRKVVDLTPDNFNGYLVLGGLYTAMGRYGDAEKLLKQSVAVKPTDRAYSNLGTLSFVQAHYTEAIAMYEKAVELGAGSSYSVVGNLADSYRWAPGFQEKALPTYRRAIELAERQLTVNPKDATVLSRIAAYRAHAGDPRQALADIGRARQLAPGDTTIGFKAVLVNEIAGRRSAALHTLDEILKAGYSLEQVEREPELQKLRQDPAYRRLASRYLTNQSK